MRTVAAAESIARQDTFPRSRKRVLPMVDVRRLAAFTQDPAAGNPAGVVVTEEELGFSAMQRIAADVGYSETAFLTPQGQASYRVRYFSPVTEVPFCGHATIAAAVELGDRHPDVDVMTFHTNTGPVEVEIHRDGDGTAATLTAPLTRNRPVLAPVLDEVLECFGWSSDVLDPALQPVEAYGGAMHLVLPLASRNVLRRMNYDFDRLRDLMWNCNWTTVALLWREAADLYHVRNAFPIGGVTEDPATGAAAAAIGGLLRDLHLIGPAGQITILQGEDMGRPSIIRVSAPAGQNSVKVRGMAVRIPAEMAMTSA